MMYYYDDRVRDDNVFGISTQSQMLAVARDERGVVGRINVYNHNRPFLYQSIGTWGQLLFPRHWIEFRLWYDTVKMDPSYQPVVDGVGKSLLRTTSWYKSAGDKIWTPWFLKFLVKRRWYGMYVNFASKKYLSVSYQEAGISYAKTEGPNSPIITHGDQIRWSFPDAKKLQRFDICFTRVSGGQLFELSHDPLSYTTFEFQRFLWNYSYAARNVIVVHGADNPHLIPIYLGWICGAKASSVNRFIFVTGNKQVSRELLNRGAGVFFVPGLEQFYEETRYVDKEPIEFENGFDGLLFGSTRRKLAKYDRPPEDEEMFINQFKNFDYYAKKHHRFLKKYGIKWEKYEPFYKAKISHALDILSNEILRNGYNLCISSVFTLFKSNPFDKIYQAEAYNSSVVKQYNDVFLSPDYDKRYNSWDMNSFKRITKDQREWVFIKCTDRTKLAYELVLDNVRAVDEKYTPVVNIWYQQQYNNKKQATDETKKAISKLRFITLAHLFNTLQNVYNDNDRVSTASLVISDVSCCINTDRLNKNSSSDLLTSLYDYIQVLERAGVCEIDQVDVMCYRVPCYSAGYRRAVEEQAREFDKGQG